MFPVILLPDTSLSTAAQSLSSPQCEVRDRAERTLRGTDRHPYTFPASQQHSATSTDHSSEDCLANPAFKKNLHCKAVLLHVVFLLLILMLLRNTKYNTTKFSQLSA